MGSCATCGRALSDAARFCPDCGNPVTTTPAPAPQVAAQSGAPACSSCGAVVREGDVFCGECGASVQASPPLPSQPEAAEGSPATVASAGSPGAPAEPADDLAAPFAAPPAPAAEAAGAAPAAPPVQPQPAPAPAQPAFAAPVYPSEMQYGAAGFQAPVPQPGTFEDYLAFRKLFTAGNAATVFWLAIGINAVFWIMQWVMYHYSGAQAFFWCLSGFVLASIVIRVVVEAAVAVTRGTNRN
jgi:RNA polymerase subunit RPABC4/transcription elongation factor Spt4